MLRQSLSKLALAAGLALGGAAAHADLSPAGIYTGNVGLSVDGIGGTAANPGDVQASVPLGATVLQAFLYAATIPNATRPLAFFDAAGITLAGQAITNFSRVVGIPGYSTGVADVTTSSGRSSVAAVPACSTSPSPRARSRR
jgi:hypothetical protein